MSGRNQPDRHLGCFVDLDSLLAPPPFPTPLEEWGAKIEDLHSGNGGSDWQTGTGRFQTCATPIFTSSEPRFVFLGLLF